ncbi:MAG: substrate-binding domain-containing protein [Erythrobacter sp.]
MALLSGSRLALCLGALGALAACGDGEEQVTDEAISIVGSSTVYPFAQRVAQDFAAAIEGAAEPVIVSTGTREGIEEFCAGEGPDTPDIVNASRRMTETEFNRCTNNGVSEIIEIKIGRDGVVFVSAIDEGIELELTPEIIYSALAANPFGDEQRAVTWSDVAEDLPAESILVYGPPETSGTRDALLDVIMESACRKNAAMAALEAGDEQAFERNCHSLRGDDAYLNQGEQDDVIVRKVANNPRAIGIFGYSYLEENGELVKGLPVNGVEPSAQTIADGSYPASRGLYIYVKKAHLDVTPNLLEFLSQWQQSWSAGGPLEGIGLVPATDAQQSQSAAAIAERTALRREDLTAADEAEEG